MSIVPSNPSSASSERDVPAGQARSLPPARHRVRRAPAPPPPDKSSKQASDYEVGYRRPPVHTRFKPGTIGQPEGSPKGARGLNTLARELLTAKVPVRTASGEKRMHRIEAVLHKTFELALKGNPRALSQVLSLYASAVPETAVANSPLSAEQLTMTDLAILDEFKASLFRSQANECSPDALRERSETHSLPSLPDEGL